MHSASSINVVDMSSGQLLIRSRFPTVTAALEYLSRAILMCSVCDKRFSQRSTHTLMIRGSFWELMFPHDCCSKSPRSASGAIERQSAVSKASADPAYRVSLSDRG
jgi:hypothetical protein